MKHKIKYLVTIITSHVGMGYVASSTFDTAPLNQANRVSVVVFS